MAAYAPWLGYLLLIASLVYVWRLASLQASRARALRVLRWIETALAEHGHVAGIEWRGPTKFSVPLRLRTSAFRNPAMVVQLAPANLLFRTLSRLFRTQKEVITFEADLDHAPSFSLELQSLRMFARTRRYLTPNGPGWRFESTTPFILTTRMDWEQEIGSLISRLSNSTERNFLSVRFNRQSPHFSASIPLEALAPKAEHRASFFDALRELAAGAHPGMAR